MRPLPIAVGALALALPTAAVAQGTVSSQGFGDPPGQFSTAARATGGAAAEFDPASPVNPASLGFVPATTLFAHYAPESRRVSVGSATADSRVVRFPVVGAALTLGGRGAIGITSATLLDRSWATQVTTGGTSGLTETFESRGALSDVRFAGAYGVSRQLTAGLGVHLLTGSNRLTVTRVDLSGVESSFQQTSELGFSGTAASLGAAWTPGRTIAVAASGQVGGRLRASLGDSLVSKATAPARVAGSVRYSGITGASIVARAAWEGWSSLGDLGTERLVANDVMDVAVGADVVGPRVFGRPMALRVGGRWRDLPFSVLGAQPTERALAGGVGLLLGGGRAALDLSVERARRSAGAARESAWVFGAGVTVRP